jgi:hypothetical protein
MPFLLIFTLQPLSLPSPDFDTTRTSIQQFFAVLLVLSTFLTVLVAYICISYEMENREQEAIQVILYMYDDRGRGRRKRFEKMIRKEGRDRGYGTFDESV